MDPKNKFSGLIVLAAFATILCFSRTGAAQSPPPFNKTKCDSIPHRNDIEVGTDVSCKLALVSKNDPSQIVRWRAVDPNMNVKIEFSWPNPFVNMTNCDGTKRMCVADSPGAPGDQQKVYLYTASLCDHLGACNVVSDPGIIIVP